MITKKAVIYARVSTFEQNADMQLLELRDLAARRGLVVVKEYVDHISGSRSKRPGLDEMLIDAGHREFDVLLVWAADRLARSVRHFLEVLDEMQRLEIEFISLRENIDTGGPLGRAVMVIVGAVAELERNLIIERVKSGMRRAKLEGRHIGRKPLVSGDQVSQVVLVLLRPPDLLHDQWEHVALELATRARINAARSRIEYLAGKDVLILERFDRQPTGRLAFLSAMSMLGASDGDAGHSYLDIADSLRQHGATPSDDIAELWRRVVFNILISNTDDHLRNHGFLYQGGPGWRLSPAYDLNPVPVDVRPRVLTTLINSDDGTASLDLAFSVAEYFGLEQNAAKHTAREVGQAVSTWRQVAAQQNIPKAEITRMASAFEHADVKTALAIKVSGRLNSGCARR